MPQVDQKLVNELSDYGMKKKVLADGSLVWSGPWLKQKNGEPVWFDGGYTEALYANTREKERLEREKLGLNEHWQTKEQADAFNKRRELSKKNKEKAAIINESLQQLK